jgi:hypothetical protein
MLNFSILNFSARNCAPCQIGWRENATCQPKPCDNPREMLDQCESEVFLQLLGIRVNPCPSVVEL